MSASKKLLALFIGFTVFQLVGVIGCGVDGYLSVSWIGETIVMLAISYFLYKSYTTHTKNVMKPLLGAALALVLEFELSWALDDIQYVNAYVDYYALNILAIVCDIIVFVCVAVMNFNHYKINSTHSSATDQVSMNKMLFIIYVIALICRAAFIVTCVKGNTAMMIGDVCASLSDAFFVSMVVVIESTLDEFKQEREAKAE